MTGKSEIPQILRMLSKNSNISDIIPQSLLAVGEEGVGDGEKLRSLSHQTLNRDFTFSMEEGVPSFSQQLFSGRIHSFTNAFNEEGDKAQIPHRHFLRPKRPVNFMFSFSSEARDENEKDFGFKENESQGTSKSMVTETDVPTTSIEKEVNDQSSKKKEKKTKRPYYRKNKTHPEVLKRVEAERLQRKRLKNRELAAKSRKKKKARVSYLETENKKLKTENKSLKEEILELKEQLSSLK